MEDEKCVGLDYEKELYKTREEMDYRLKQQQEEISRSYESKLESMYSELIKYENELKFYKDMIKSILHIN